jgi:hypothetical protein
MARSVDQAIVAPATSVTLDASTGDAGSVMVVDSQSIAHERKVTVGVRSGELIQITAGLQPNEVVVTAGGYALPDGTQVQVAEKPRPEAAPK